MAALGLCENHHYKYSETNGHPALKIRKKIIPRITNAIEYKMALNNWR